MRGRVGGEGERGKEAGGRRKEGGGRRKDHPSIHPCIHGTLDLAGERVGCNLESSNHPSIHALGLQRCMPGLVEGGTRLHGVNRRWRSPAHLLK